MESERLEMLCGDDWGACMLRVGKIYFANLQMIVQLLPKYILPAMA